MPPKPHALTLVLNPNARKPRLKPPSIEKLEKKLGPNSRIHITRDLEDLDRLMKSWKNEEETLCFYGGDGSIARGLTSLIRHKGESYRLPPVLTVRAGTINMLCSILGFREKVDTTFDRWTRNELNTLRQIPTLKVEVGNEPPQYGFIFSWGVGYRVLKQYYDRKHVPDAVDAMAVMTKTFLSAILPGADRSPMFKGQEIKLMVDGKSPGTEPVRSLLVGTIERLSLGIKPFAPKSVLPDGFHVSVNSMPLTQVAWHSPTLLFQLGDQRELTKKLGNKLFCDTQVKELRAELTEGFTMDGEMFELSRPTKVRISPGPVVQFWTKA